MLNMMTDKLSVDLTPQQFAVIEAALHTQEKILSVQSLAGQDRVAANKLSELKTVLKSLRRQSPSNADRGNGMFGTLTRALFE